MLPGISFEVQRESVSSAQHRVDMPCFLGFVRSRRHKSGLPTSVHRFLTAHGFIGGADARPAADIEVLSQVPVPVESYSAFLELYDAEQRAKDAPGYLAAAVRSFFAQGGRSCFVVCAGAPLRRHAVANVRRERLRDLIPAGGDAALSPVDPRSWRGIGLLHGLPEASFLSLPDLPYLASAELAPLPPPAEEVTPRAHFVECVDTPLPPANTAVLTLEQAPRLLNRPAYQGWAQAVRDVLAFLARHRKDVQLVASLPLPVEGREQHYRTMSALTRWGLFDDRASDTGLASAHLQLAYPWFRWEGSEELPEKLEPPEGALLGVLARTTLQRGTYASAARQELLHARGFSPELSLADRERPYRVTSGAADNASTARSLQQRVSLFGPTLDGPALLSDVTTSGDEAWRQAPVNRLMSVWVRALRQVGEELTFGSSGPVLWAQVRERLGNVGAFLLSRGALREGANGAYQVRCDRSTMSQLDLDEGRLVAEVSFQPALPIEAIRVALALDEQQRVSVRTEAS